MIRYTFHRCSSDLLPAAPYGHRTAEIVRKFHQSFPEYAPTPFVRLNALSQKLGVKGVYLKDESFRFGLNAFKVLGGSYAIGCSIAEELGEESITCEKMLSREVKEKLGHRTFITATDGNHGRGVAWTASRLGQESVVYMPKGTARERLDNILALGSRASITELSYDDAVRKAAHDAAENRWTLIQDTSSEGYENIPRHIMQGYTTMALEAVEQLNGTIPTHVFLQAGVGSMAGALSAFFADYYGSQKPIITIVEPLTADCIYQTALADDGKLYACTNEMKTMMAGLACGEPCSIAWELLRRYADCFIAVPDTFAAAGMSLLAHPYGNDPSVISGESGAAGIGTLVSLFEIADAKPLAEQLKLDSESIILCFSTEGATDRSNYTRITGIRP